MLAGKGFSKVYNLSGGIKAWEKAIAFGPEDQGLELFSGQESSEESIIVAFGLEEGLRDFYLSMTHKSPGQSARTLFAKLAAIEILHQQRLLALYQEITGREISLEEFAAGIVSPALEGGMSTESYLARFHGDLSAITDIISLAMSIEAQALDLYQRAADRAQDEASRRALKQIANEERAHLQHLADYMDHLTE